MSWNPNTINQDWWIQLVDFLRFLTRKTTFATSCLLFCTQGPFWKGVISKRKEFGSKFFSFREDPFQKGTQSILTDLPPLKVYPFPLSASRIFWTLSYMIFRPIFCFLCSCFLKYFVEWQTVLTQIRLLLAPSGAVWSGSALFAHAILSETLMYEILGH